MAVSALIQCGRYYSTELDIILDFCVKRENEQDFVHLAMITTLADLPPTRWLEEHLPKLRQIISATLKARDCSFQTMNAASRLLLKMIMVHTNFVVDELPTLVERMGHLNTLFLESQITNEDVIKLDSCLLPLMKTWVARDRTQVAVSLICSFGCRIKSVLKQKSASQTILPILFKPQNELGMVKLLIELTQDKRGHIARTGLEALIILGINEEVAQLIPRLIKEDESWVQVSCVSEYLHRNRQNLLTPFLMPRKYRNRFSSGKTAVILNFNNRFLRWTANQQQIYADALNTILCSNKRNVWELYSCINRLCVMPSANLSVLKNLAKQNAADVSMRDKALEALGRTDAGRGINELLQALSDDRARIAIYALRRSILEMTAKNAMVLLSKAPRNKVTIIKEIIRLAGEFDGEHSYYFLCTFLKDKDLYSDVKIALLRAFWKHLNNEEIWGYFHTAALSEHTALARSTIHIPQEGLTQNARQHLCEQVTLLLKNTNAQIRLETLERLVSMPLIQVDDALFKSLTELLEDVDVYICKLATEALLSIYILKKDDELVETFAKVKRPQSIVAIVDAFEHRSIVNVSGLKSCAKSFVLAMLNQRCQPSLDLHLSIVLLEPFDIFEIIENIDNAGLLHPVAVESNLKTWNITTKNYLLQDMVIIETKLRLSPSAGMRRLGFGLLIELSSQYGWTNELRSYLHEYCTDKELWVSEEANLVEPPQTLENTYV